MLEESMNTLTSKWQIWGLATVTEHKPFGVDTIRCSSIERLPNQSGYIGESVTSYNNSISDSEGVASVQNLTMRQVIEAEWVPDGDNHLFTSPMVRKGEVVVIFKYADKKGYYWNTLFRSPEIRRTERIIWGAGNLSGGNERLDLDSIYYLEFDTLDKTITLKTSLSDGEEFMYTLCLSPKDRQAWIADHIGNRFYIDSRSNNVVLEDISGGKYETRDGHPKVTGTKGILLTSPSNVIEGDTVFTDNVTINKNLTIIGSMSVGKGMSMGSGSAIFNGSMRVTGYADFPGGHGPH